MENYKPTKFMAKDSYYDEFSADFAVAFIEQLKHTKGKWAGKNFKLMPWQEQIVRDIFGILKPDGNRQFRTAYVEIGKKQGKQLALDTPLPTPEGWTTMGDVEVGDELFDEKGNRCRVVAKSAIDDTEQAYRLTFRDGSSIVAGENHLWNVQVCNNGYREKVIRTEDMYNNLMKFREKHLSSDKKRSIYRIQVNKAIQTDDIELPVDPYLYGYWLGNGHSTKPDITVSDGDLGEIIRNIPYKHHHLYPQLCGGSFIVSYHELKPILVKNFREKVIRPEYLRASESQRWELLQGLIDSDGCVGLEKSQTLYVSTIKQLAESVRELLWTLGIKNAMTTTPSTRFGVPTGETLYQIRFTTFEDQPTSRLKRKMSRARERKKETRSCFHYLKSIEKLDEKVKMQCVQVDSASHCYLAGKSMVPTHNSELAAAIALYLLFADGEPSAEVYGAAADRQQASIVFDVARQMVVQCPALAKRCKILTANKRINNFSNNGIYQVLSADVQTKHGLNVSGLVLDEVHAQPNRKLYDVLTKGSGDAREQPLYFLITTAGTDKNSICYELHTKAMDLLKGRKIDPTFYPVVYGLDKDDDWHDEKNWYKANPSLGTTITIERVRDAYRDALQNPAEENVFKQLRLNMWVDSITSWMPKDRWDACTYEFDESSLEGRVCYGGLDLSSSTDITAFVLVFPPEEEGDKYIILPYFWLPEDNIPLRVNRDHVPYDIWRQQGLFNATEGNVIHYAYIENFIEELGTRFNIREIAFDRWGAVQMVQNLEGMGFTVVPFGQGFKDMSPPTKELMKMVLAKEIAHSGHPVLSWMVDNVVVRTDPAGNVKMDKAKSTEKIDGAVAMVMALDRAIRCGNDNSASVYDERGLLFF